MPGIRKGIREKRSSSSLQPPLGSDLWNEQGGQGRKLFWTERAVLFRCFQHLLIHFDLGDLPPERNDAGNMARERIFPHFKGDALPREILLGVEEPRLIFSPIKFNFIHTSLPPLDSRTPKVRDKPPFVSPSKGHSSHGAVESSLGDIEVGECTHIVHSGRCQQDDGIENIGSCGNLILVSFLIHS